MDVFERLKNGEPVDMMSEEYGPAITELHRADKALFHLNHAEPGSEEQKKAFDELFDGTIPDGLGIFTPTQIDFPKQITFGRHVFINHNFTAMSIGGIEFGDNVQIGPHVTIVTDNHDLDNRYVLKCKTQTREEYFADIEKGRLNYFKIGIEAPVIEVDGDTATIEYTSVLNANAYGARGTFRMSGIHHYEKRDGSWILVNR